MLCSFDTVDDRHAEVSENHFVASATLVYSLHLVDGLLASEDEVDSVGHINATENQ